MLHLPNAGQQVFEVSIYNRNVRTLVKENQSPHSIDDQWADIQVRDVIARDETEARRLSLATLRMPSGAGHDAQSVALLGPVGMIFVPSLAGISHSPLEMTTPEQITAGANVLLRSLLALDEDVV